MNRMQLETERVRLQAILSGHDLDSSFGQQGDLDRMFADDRKRYLISRIAYMDNKLAKLA